MIRVRLLGARWVQPVSDGFSNASQATVRHAALAVASHPVLSVPYVVTSSGDALPRWPQSRGLLFGCTTGSTRNFNDMQTR